MQFRQGTVNVTNGSASVVIDGVENGSLVGTGQQFKTDRDGDAIYQIASRTPSSGAVLTNVTLSVPYTGATGNGLSYQICTDFSINRSYPLPQQGDADAADWITSALVKIDQDIASVIGAVGTGGGVVLNQGQVPFWDNGLKGETEFTYINATNRLGLGTGFPSYRLHLQIGNTGQDGIKVSGLTGIDAFIGVYDGVCNLNLLSNSGVPQLQTDATKLVFSQGGSERLRIDAGRIIIGGNTVVPGGAQDGDIVIKNGAALRGHDAAGTTPIALIGTTTSDCVYLSPEGVDIYWGIPMVALGGGANATPGTVGGSGPAVTAQDGWMKGKDSAGDFFIAIWR